MYDLFILYRLSPSARQQSKLPFCTHGEGVQFVTDAYLAHDQHACQTLSVKGVHLRFHGFSSQMRAEFFLVRSAGVVGKATSFLQAVVYVVTGADVIGKCRLSDRP